MVGDGIYDIPKIGQYSTVVVIGNVEMPLWSELTVVVSTGFSGNTVLSVHGESNLRK
jgi:hypothetical protein